MSPRGDHKSKSGERGNLYCTWPHCDHYGDRVRVGDAVQGRGPHDATECCDPKKAKRKSGRGL